MPLLMFEAPTEQHKQFRCYQVFRKPLDTSFTRPRWLPKTQQHVLAQLAWRPRMRRQIRDVMLLQAARTLQRKRVIGRGRDGAYFVQRHARVHANNVLFWVMRNTLQGGV